MTTRVPVRGVLRDAQRYEPVAPLFLGSRLVGFDSPASDAPPWFALPGLRNAHAHFDLSHVASIPRATRGFAAWLLDLLPARGPFDPAAFQRAAATGATLSLRSGTTAVVDIDSSGAAASAVAMSGLKGWACHEMLGNRDPVTMRNDVSAWLARFDSFAPKGRLRAGVSPHAPYSTPAALYRAASELAAEHTAGFTTHLAETHAEDEFTRRGEGEFRDLLQRLNVVPPFSDPPGASPIRYVSGLGDWPRGAILAHVNYPNADEFELLARRRAIVAYCPRSHAFFGHSRHPIAELLAAGIPVALGTDSLASNGTLSLFDEMAYLRAARPDLPAATIFECATSNAARSIDGGSGRLDDLQAADLVVVAARGGVPSNLEEALDLVTSGTLEVVATFVDGELCYVAPGVSERFLV